MHRPPPEAIRRGRLKLALLALFFAAPFALAWLAWRLDWAPGTTSNYGELITPARPLEGAPLDELRGKWVLVTFDRAACDAYCEQKLYFMRQVRRAQGKDQERVARLWLVTDGGEPHPELLSSIRGTLFRKPFCKILQKSRRNIPACAPRSIPRCRLRGWRSCRRCSTSGSASRAALGSCRHGFRW